MDPNGWKSTSATDLHLRLYPSGRTNEPKDVAKTTKKRLERKVRFLDPFSVDYSENTTHACIKWFEQR